MKISIKNSPYVLFIFTKDFVKKNLSLISV